MNAMTNERELIETLFEQRDDLSVAELRAKAQAPVKAVLERIEGGVARVAEPTDEGWRVNEWLKKAVLLYFRISENRVIDGGHTRYFDKVPCRFTDADAETFKAVGARVVPTATVRRGAHIGNDVVLMPAYVNIGAWIGPGTMVDTWATVGSCAQVGERVHLSGGAGIGGVLEPLQANPTIVEDHCFIGARSEIVEGVIVERGSVISMGVYLGQSTRIYDRGTGEILQGRVPAGSVVVPGSLPAKDGSHSLYCAVIVKRVDEKTRERVGINSLLRSAVEEDG